MHIIFNRRCISVCLLIWVINLSLMGLKVHEDSFKLANPLQWCSTVPRVFFREFQFLPRLLWNLFSSAIMWMVVSTLRLEHCSLCRNAESWKHVCIKLQDTETVACFATVLKLFRWVLSVLVTIWSYCVLTFYQEHQFSWCAYCVCHWLYQCVNCTW